jgi:hypothetical protein
MISLGFSSETPCFDKTYTLREISDKMDHLSVKKQVGSLCANYQ